MWTDHVVVGDDAESPVARDAGDDERVAEHGGHHDGHHGRRLGRPEHRVRRRLRLHRLRGPAAAAVEAHVHAIHLRSVDRGQGERGARDRRLALRLATEPSAGRARPPAGTDAAAAARRRPTHTAARARASPHATHGSANRNDDQVAAPPRSSRVQLSCLDSESTKTV